MCEMSKDTITTSKIGENHKRTNKNANLGPFEMATINWRTSFSTLGHISQD